MLMTDDLDNHDDVPQARGKGPAMSHELHDYAEIYTPSREEPASWIGPQVTLALLVQAVEVVPVVMVVKVVKVVMSFKMVLVVIVVKVGYGMQVGHNDHVDGAGGAAPPIRNQRVENKWPCFEGGMTQQNIKDLS